MRSLAAALSLLALGVPTQDMTAQGAPRVIATIDELTGAADQRAILRSQEWRSSTRGDGPDEWRGSTLLVACGDRFPGDSGRAVLFFAGEPMQPFGNELAYADIRVGSGSKQRKLYMPLLDWGDILIGGPGGRSNRYLGFVGTDKPPYFSATLFRELLAADTLTVIFTNYDQRRRTVTFDLSPLASLIDRMQGCSWPR